MLPINLGFRLRNSRKKRLKILRIFRKDNPLITAYAELPHRGGKPFGWSLTDYSAFPWGKGDRRRKPLVDEGCFRLSLASRLCYTNDTSYTHTGICLAERFLELGLSQFRAYRGAGAGLLEICMHFSSSLRRSLRSLNVRPNNLSVSRFARLCVRPKNLSASRFARLCVRPKNLSASRFARLCVRPNIFRVFLLTRGRG